MSVFTVQVLVLTLLNEVNFILLLRYLQNNTDFQNNFQGIFKYIQSLTLKNILSKLIKHAKNLFASETRPLNF